MKKNAVALSPHINKLLDDILTKRSDDNPSFTHTKVGIVAELIFKAHKREMK